MIFFEVKLNDFWRAPVCDIGRIEKVTTDLGLTEDVVEKEKQRCRG
jgi:hypothetical protein